MKIYGTLKENDEMTHNSIDFREYFLSIQIIFERISLNSLNRGWSLPLCYLLRFQS